MRDVFKTCMSAMVLDLGLTFISCLSVSDLYPSVDTVFKFLDFPFLFFKVSVFKFSVFKVSFFKFSVFKVSVLKVLVFRVSVPVL